MAIDEIKREVERILAKYGPQDALPDGTGARGFIITCRNARAEFARASDEGELTWAHVLREEVYEALECQDDETDALREELIQVAAVCLVWVMAIDRRPRQRDPSGRED